MPRQAVARQRGDARFEAWFAPPAAGEGFDPARLCAADARRWAAGHVTRRRTEWLASRALLERAAPPAGAATSLAHSNGHAALLLATAAPPVGVDLEPVRPRDVLGLAALAFAPDEQDALASLDPAARVLHFHLLWTLKEACAKAFGLELLAALRECRFDAGQGGRWRGHAPAPGPWRAAAWAPEPGWVLAAAWSPRGIGEPHVEIREPRKAIPEPCGAVVGPRLRRWPDGAAADWPALAHVEGGPDP